MTHIDESAELYALGMLDQTESDAVLVHARRCEPCAQLLLRAQQVVAAMSEGVEQHEPSPGFRDRVLASTDGQKSRRPWPWFGAGLAAGLLAAALVLMPGRLTINNSPSSDELALTTIVQSHFNHVSFVALRQGAPHAKALYGKHLEWIYVVVHNPPTGLEVQIQTRTGARNLGALRQSGENSTLFVRAPGPLEHIVLLQGGAAIARAAPVASP